MKSDFDFMQAALDEAEKAFEKDEVPVGAVLVFQNEIIARTHNLSITNQDPTSHAEILVMREAGKVLGNYRLCDCSIYVSLEPCAMCYGAMVHARIKQLFFAANDMKTGVCGGAIDLYQSPIHNHSIECKSGLFAEQSRKLLQEFFKAKRQNKE